MTLVERFIEMDAWPTRRKTVLVMGPGLGAHLFDWLLLHGLLTDNPAFDLAVIDRLMAGGALVLLFCLLAGAAAALASRPGDWPAVQFL